MTRRRALLLVVVLAATSIVIPRPANAAPSFDRVVAFATKTGYRAVIAWQASAPVSAEVRLGTSPTNLNRVAASQPPQPDAAGMVVVDDLFNPYAPATPAQTWFVQVTDTSSGVRSAIVEFDATNAYRDWNGTSYTVDLLVSVDSPAVSDDVPHDLGLQDIAAGMNILAERIYDATDGFVIIGNVLVTEVDALADSSIDLSCYTPTAIADIEVLTAPPFSSQTSRWGIEDPCSTIMIGREGQLAVHRWIDDLHVGHVTSHEVGHYGFGADDLYTVASDFPGGVNCDNPSWDGSLMHNSGGWNPTLGRWDNTELDRNPMLTPCQHGSSIWSWDALRSRYTNVPRRPSGPVEHIIDTEARGNPDGGSLAIWVLDRDVRGSTLTAYAPDDALPVP